MGFKQFISCFLVLFMLAVFVPFINTALQETTTTSPNMTTFEAAVNGSSYLSIALNIAFIAFWTFGLNAWINLLILIPLRVFLLVSLWYIISPAK